MELWIRSQDKKRLTKIEGVYMIEDEDGKDNILSFPKYYIGNTLVGHLGVYKTRERALEVLDEIQDHILNLGETVLNYGKEYKTYGRVYEMPKE